MLVAGPLIYYVTTQTVNCQGEQKRKSKYLLSSEMVIKDI